MAALDLQGHARGLFPRGLSKAAAARTRQHQCLRTVTHSRRKGTEHLEVMTRNPERDARHLRRYGALFLGAGAAEVLGDYGPGPDHVLRTGSSARCKGGLPVFDFLRVRTWMRMDRIGEAGGPVHDAVSLARLEGLEGHARSALRRRS